MFDKFANFSFSCDNNLEIADYDFKSFYLKKIDIILYLFRN